MFTLKVNAFNACLITSGCTGTSTIPSYGQVLVGNHSNGYDLVSTSTFGGSGGGSGSVTSIGTNNGLTGGTITTSGTIGLQTSGFSTNAPVTWNGSNLVATGTQQLTVGNLLATSTATSTFRGGIDAVRVCITGTVTCLNTSSGIIISTSTVYIETAGSDSTGLINRPDKPFLTIDAGIAALPSTGGVVKLGVGVFSPHTYSPTLASTTFIGSGQPNFNLTYTGLVGGTIIQGPLDFDNNNIKIYDLGVDSGSAVVTALYGGTDQDALVFSNDGQIASPSVKPPRTGVVVHNVTVLCKAWDSLHHAALFENLYAPDIQNIKATYCVHGIVFKVTNGNASNLYSAGNEFNAIIVKSNVYAAGSGLNISNVVMKSGPFGETSGGLRFVNNDNTGGTAPALTNIQVSNVVADGTSFDIEYDSGSNSMNNIYINNLTGINGAGGHSINGGGVYLPSLYINGYPLSNEFRFPSGAVTAPSTGKGLEEYYDSSADLGVLLSYDRDTSAYKNLNMVSHGFYVNNDASTVFSVAGSKAGVGTTSPYATFSVTGTAGQSNYIFEAASSTNATSTAFIINKDGYQVGGNRQAFLSVSGGTGNCPDGGAQSITNSFTTVTTGTTTSQIIDFGGNWNSGTSIYTVPVSGTYALVGHIRYNEQSTTAVDYGLGIYTSNIDGPGNFFWSVQPANSGVANSVARSGLQFSNNIHFTKGDQLRLYSYVDNGGTGMRVCNSAMTVNLMYADN